MLRISIPWRQLLAVRMISSAKASNRSDADRGSVSTENIVATLFMTGSSKQKILLLSPLSPHLSKYSMVSASMILTCSLKCAMFSPVFSIFFCSRKICKECGGIHFYQTVTLSYHSSVDWFQHIRVTHRIGDIIGHSSAKHWSGQFGVNILSVQVFILAVKHECGCFAAQKVGEGFPHHGETEHWAVLWEGGWRARFLQVAWNSKLNNERLG